MRLPFRKVEGLGNDFVLVDETQHDVDLERFAAVAPTWCDRRIGVGADGILLVGKPDPHSDGSMIVINHDGSRPEMCGNGLRCVALHLHEKTGRRELVIRTDAGPKTCVFSGTHPELEIEVDMGPGMDLGPKTVDSGRTFAGVSMGNPHAIAFVEGDPKPLAHDEGPIAERDRAFPDRSNIEFARLDPAAITLWVWERGCGITQACGTGACATACAAVWQGHRPADTPLAIDLPGGRLWITVPSDANAGVLMRGPARVVFDGHIDRP